MNDRKPDDAKLFKAVNRKKPEAQDVYVFKGLPLVCIDNLDDFTNRQEFVVRKVTDKQVWIIESVILPVEIDMIVGQKHNGMKVRSIKNELAYMDRTYIIDFDMLMLNFRPNYCINVHVAQSATIRGDIMIHEINQFNQNMAYTALSRATSLDSIYIYSQTAKVYKFEPFVYDNNRSEPDSPNLTENIAGYIYHLVRDEKVFYVGQTDNLERRRIEHMANYGKNFSIVRVKTVLKGVDIDAQERKEIKRMIKEGAQLVNKKLLPKEEKVATVIKGVVKERTKLKGCITVDKKNEAVYFKYSVRGVSKEKKWRYKRCGFDVAMAKAKQFQIEMYT